MVQLFAAPPKREVMPNIPQDRPVYRILNDQGYYGPNDRLYEQGEILVLWDVPNDDMEPLNDMARERLEAYLDTLEESARIVAEKNGRHFAGRPRDKHEMLELATMDARRAQTIGMSDAGVKIMGAKKNTKARISDIGATETPMMGAAEEAMEARRARVGDIS